MSVLEEGNPEDEAWLDALTTEIGTECCPEIESMNPLRSLSFLMPIDEGSVPRSSKLACWSPQMINDEDCEDDSFDFDANQAMNRYGDIAVRSLNDVDVLLHTVQGLSLQHTAQNKSSLQVSYKDEEPKSLEAACSPGGDGGCSEEDELVVEEAAPSRWVSEEHEARFGSAHDSCMDRWKVEESSSDRRTVAEPQSSRGEPIKARTTKSWFVALVDAVTEAAGCKVTHARQTEGAHSLWQAVPTASGAL
jgi:hypothetical protein